MFVLGLIYLIIIIVLAVFALGPWPDLRNRWAGLPALVLFIIIGIALFWKELNR